MIKKMVHPSELLRTNSEEENSPHFAAPINVVSKKDIDCGFTSFPLLTTSIWNLEKLAKPSVYLICLCILAFLNGFVFSYFPSTSYIWKQEYNFTKYVADLILYADKFFIGIFSLIIAYWGSRIHKMSWLGGLTIYHAIAGWCLIIPELYQKYERKIIIELPPVHLCNPYINTSSAIEELSNENEVFLAIFLIYQLLGAMAQIAFFTLGLTYLDDSLLNSSSKVFYIVLPFVIEQIGRQIGVYSSWLPNSFRDTSIFLSPAWLIPYTLLFIIGITLAMFPRNLPIVLLNNATNSILQVLNGMEESMEIPKQEQFSRLFIKIFKNKLIMFNTIAFAFLYAACFNFYEYENSFYRSRFLLPISLWDSSGYMQPLSLKVMSSYILPPVIAISILLFAIMIDKFRPKAKILVTWNCIVIGVAAFAIATYALFRCHTEIRSELHNKISVPYCSSKCNCHEHNQFAPVCTEEGRQTYFSPCHAGCLQMIEKNGIKNYFNCSCGLNIHELAITKAADGACNNCILLWGFVQCNRIILSGLLASTAVTSLILNLRSLPTPYKPIILALQLSVAFIINNGVLWVVFTTFANYTCKYRQNDDICDFHSENFNVGFPLLIGLLLAISATFYGATLLFVDKIELYDKEENDEEANDDNEENTRLNSENDEIRSSTPLRTLGVDFNELQRNKLYKTQMEHLNNVNENPNRIIIKPIIESNV